MLHEMLNQTQYAIFYSVIELSFSIGRCFRVGRYFFWGGGGGGRGEGVNGKIKTERYFRNTYRSLKTN